MDEQEHGGTDSVTSPAAADENDSAAAPAIADGDVSIDDEVKIAPSRCCVKQLREEKGWTREKLAEACNIDEDALADLEEHGAIADLNDIDVIAHALSVTVDDLFAAGDPRKSAEERDKESRMSAAEKKERAQRETESQLWSRGLYMAFTIVMLVLAIVLSDKVPVDARWFWIGAAVVWAFGYLLIRVFLLLWLKKHLDRKYALAKDPKPQGGARRQSAVQA